VLLRLLQGLAVGGEYPGAVVVAVEHARPARRTFFGSLSQVGTVAGLMLAGLSLLAVTLVPGEDAFRSWAWRLLFLASGVLVVVGLALRTRLAETPEFLAAHRAGGHSARAGRLGTLLREHRRPLGAAALLWTGPATLGYGFIIGLFAYVELYVPALRVLDVQVGLVLTTALVVAVTAVSGWFGDRWGAHRTVVVSGLWACAWAVPGYLLVGTGSAPALWVAMAVAGTSFGLFGGVAPALVSQAFPMHVRYLGVGVALAVGAVLGSAVLPLPALALVGVTGGSPVPLMTMVAAGGLATVAGAGLMRSRGTT
jgi:MFS family permease